MKCLIIDDNEKDIQQLIEVIQTVSKKYVLRMEVDSASNIHFIDFTQKKDVYFLDIEMPEISGFSVQKKILMTFPGARIVFFTSHSQMVFNAQDPGFYYFVRKEYILEDMDALFSKLSKSCLKKEVYTYNYDGVIVQIPYYSILYFETDRNDICIHTLDRVYRERKTLSSLEIELASNIFLKISRKCIVNTHKITMMVNDHILLTDGEQIHISKKYIHVLRKSIVMR